MKRFFFKKSQFVSLTTVANKNMPSVCVRNLIYTYILLGVINFCVRLRSSLILFKSHSLPGQGEKKWRELISKTYYLNCKVGETKKKKKRGGGKATCFWTCHSVPTGISTEESVTTSSPWSWAAIFLDCEFRRFFLVGIKNQKQKTNKWKGMKRLYWLLRKYVLRTNLCFCWNLRTSWAGASVAFTHMGCL